jgi:O-antigen/teichoic acid export membrane protein
VLRQPRRRGAEQPVIERFLQLGRHTIVYGLAGTALQLVGIVTVPIFTRVFNSSQYGVLETTIAAYSALLVLADLGITSSAQRSYFDYDAQQERERRSALSTGLSSSMALALLWAGVALIFAVPIARWQFGNAGDAHLIRIAAAGIPVAILCNFLRETVRLKLKPWAYTISMAGGAIIGTGFALIYVLGFHGGIAGLLWGMLVGNAFSCLVSFSVLQGSLIGPFSTPELWRMLKFGLPLIPTSIALWGVSLVDRSLLTKLGSGSEHAKLAATGEYALANRFSSLMMFVVTAFLLAYGPFQLTNWQEDPELEKRVRARMLPYFTILLTGLAVVLSLFAREVAQAVSPNYPTAYEAVGLLSMSVAAFGVSNIALAGIVLTRRTGYIAIYTGAALALNVVLNVILIPPWGMMGSAFATLAAYVLLAALYYWRGQILYPTPYVLRKTLVVLVSGELATLVGLVRFADLGVAVGVKLATLLAFIASLWIFGAVDHDDVTGMRLVLGATRLGRRRTQAREADAETDDEPIEVAQTRG